MKIRTGFVSNSSSSSFVIVTKRKLTKQMLIKSFGVTKRHPLREVISEIIDTIFTKAKLCQDSEDWNYYEPEYQEELKKKGKFVYIGSFDDCGNGGEEVESLLCNTDLNIRTEDFIMEHEGGY